MEYLKPTRDIDPPFDKIAESIFSNIQGSTGLKSITRYSRDDVKNLAKKLGDSFLESMTFSEAEKIRTKKNQHFPTINSGWVEVSLFRNLGKHSISASD